MKHNNYYLIIACLLIITHICVAMNEQQATILKKITFLPKSQQATFITDKWIVLRNKHKCTLLNIDNEEKYPFNTDGITDEITNLSIYSSRQQIALSTHNTATCYNTNTQEIEFIHNPSHGRFATYEFDSGSLVPYDHPNQIIVFNPNKCQFISASIRRTTNDSAYRTTIRDYEPNNIHKTIKQRIIKIKTIFSEYSADGNTLAAGNNDTIFYLKHMDDTLKYIPKKDNEEFLYFTFHPNNKFLIVLSKPYKIDYWSVRSNIPTHIMSYLLNIPKPTRENLDLKPHLSCSPNGEKLLITVDGECFIIANPCISYKNLRKEKFIFALWALDNYKNDTNDIPKETRDLLKKYLLTTYILPIIKNTVCNNDEK